MWERNSPLPSSCQLIFLGVAASLMVCPAGLADESPPFFKNVESKDAAGGRPEWLFNIYSRRGVDVSVCTVPNARLARGKRRSGMLHQIIDGVQRSLSSTPVGIESRMRVPTRPCSVSLHGKGEKIVRGDVNDLTFACTFYRGLSCVMNCEASVEPSKAVVEDIPPTTTCCTASKYPVPTNRWCFTAL
jgi:hypothetical protein